MSALLHITIDTDETTDRLKAPIVPSWYLLPSLIFTLHYPIPIAQYLLIKHTNPHKTSRFHQTNHLRENKAAFTYLIRIFHLTQQ